MQLCVNVCVRVLKVSVCRRLCVCKGFRVKVSVCKGVCVASSHPTSSTSCFSFHPSWHFASVIFIKISCYICPPYIAVHHMILTYLLHCLDPNNWVTCSSTLSGHPPSCFFWANRQSNKAKAAASECTWKRAWPGRAGPAFKRVKLLHL